MSDGVVTRALKAAGRAVHHLVHPQHAEERERVDSLARAVKAAAATEREHLERIGRQLEGVSARLADLALDRDVRGLDRRVEQLREASARQHKTLAQALKHAAWDEELRIDERRVVGRVAHMARSGRAVLVGPWSGEVGFELLYWIPFVTWALQEAQVAPERIVVVSRGGPASWYAHLGGRYLDVLSQVSPEEFRGRTEEQKKQRTVGRFDREIVRRLIATAGLERPVLLHPGLMYRLFNPFWKQKATVLRIERYARYQAVRRPDVPVLAGRLPDDYVAVRFYFNASFPDTPANRAFVEATVRNLAEFTHVVMLNTAFRVDDHSDVTMDRSSRIHVVDDLMTPDRNLDLQTAVIAGARAFVGTYGGYSYLAPLCGVPSLAFYSARDEFFAHHLELAERVFRAMRAGSLVPIDVRDADLVRMALTTMPRP